MWTVKVVLIWTRKIAKGAASVCAQQGGTTQFNQLAGKGGTHLSLIARAVFMHTSPRRIASVAGFNSSFPSLVCIPDFVIIALMWLGDIHKKATLVT